MGYLSNKEIKKLKFKKIGKNILISDKASIITPSKIEIGDNTRIDDFSLLYGSISLGKNVHITPMCLLGAGDVEIFLNDFSTLAYGVKIFSQSDDYIDGYMTNSTIDNDFKKIDSGKVVLEKHVIIGTNSVIFPGCRLREGTSVGAMSLIKSDTKSWSVYSGVPAKYKKKRKKISNTIISKFLKSKLK
jgi:acetyltransferase-like isoleucine patch superfamily enzyme